MIHKVTVPNVGESITEVFIGHWQQQNGDFVEKDEVLVDLETQKTSFEIHAPASGKIEILFPEPETKVKPGDVIAKIDDSVAEAAGKEGTAKETEKNKEKPEEEEKAKESKKEKKPDQREAGEKEAGEIESLGGPAARKLAAELGIDLSGMEGSGKGGRVLKEDILRRE
ncbi:MAG: biotin/lipoyl-containing protein, partial [Candidatus Binatia bacterium]